MCECQEVELCSSDISLLLPLPQEWPPQQFSTNSITISYEAQSSLVYDLSHDISQTNITPYRSDLCSWLGCLV